MNATSLIPPAHVLLCDPSEKTLSRLGKHLEAWGFQVLLAASNAEALHLLRISAASSGPVDLLLADGAMFQGKKNNLLEQIRADKDLSDLPVVLLAPSPAALPPQVAAQADELLALDVDPNSLFSRLSSLIRRSRALSGDSRVAACRRNRSLIS